MVEQKISLDFSKNGVQRTVHARQGENAARDILISLVSNGEPVDVSEFTLWVIYPDGTHSVPESKNPVKVTIPQALCLTVGEKICEIQVKHGDDLLYSPQFRIQVEGTILGASGSSEPIADPTVYEPLIAQAQAYSGVIDNLKIPVHDLVHEETRLTTLSFLLSDVTDELDDKVDKVSGKGLSTNDYTTEDKTKLAGIESGAEVNDITDVQDENGNSLVTSKIAVIPSGNPTELVAGEYYDLNFTTTAILDKYEASIAMTYEAHPVVLVEKYGANGADIFYISKYSGQIVVYRARYNNQTSLAAQTVIGTLSEAVYTSTEKTKLEGIDAGAEVNDVTDVQDTGGNSLVTNKVAVIPNAMIEIFDKTESSVDYAKYTGADLYSLVSDSGGKLYCINGNQIVGMSVVDIDSGSYFIYYLIGGAFSSPADFNCALRRITLDNNKVLSNDALCGSFSKADFTSTEKNKLAGIAANAQVNTIEKITDSNGTELTITNKTVTLPETSLTDAQMIAVCSVLSDFVTVNGNYVACNNNVLTA